MHLLLALAFAGLQWAQCECIDDYECSSQVMLIQRGLVLEKATAPADQLLDTTSIPGCHTEDGDLVHAGTEGCPCLGEGRPVLEQRRPPQELVDSFDFEQVALSYPEMVAKRPVAWVHCPKCGSSFENSLLHHPAVCPFIPDNVRLNSTEECGGAPVPEFNAAYPEEWWCPGGTSPTFSFAFQSRNHFGITDEVYRENQGNFMMVLRQPEQRTMSAWNHNMHSWGLREYYIPSTVREFAEGNQGCQTRMLSLREPRPSPCSMPVPPPAGLPSQADVDLAKQRLREGFSFVGITGRWEETICLFHAMFGGRCLELEFDNMRVGDSNFNPDTPYDTSELDGFVDPYDGQVFQEAETIFNETLQSYGVTYDVCKTLCPSHFM